MSSKEQAERNKEMIETVPLTRGQVERTQLVAIKQAGSFPVGSPDREAWLDTADAADERLRTMGKRP